MTAPPRVFELPGSEPILHFGASGGAQLLVLQPLFEEANRCRAFVVRLCRDLAARGLGCWLPDLPGEGESLRALASVGWSDWSATVAAACATIVRECGMPPAGSVAIRGGALLDHAIDRRWRLAPVTGGSLLTDLRRAGLLANGAYALEPALADPLAAAEPAGAARVVRLAGDERPCDRHVEGIALWRRPEPADDPALATLLAQDIADWLAA